MRPFRYHEGPGYSRSRDLPYPSPGKVWVPESLFAPDRPSPLYRVCLVRAPAISALKPSAPRSSQNLTTFFISSIMASTSWWSVGSCHGICRVRVFKPLIQRRLAPVKIPHELPVTSCITPYEPRVLPVLGHRRPVPVCPYVPVEYLFFSCLPDSWNHSCSMEV